jgi:hypothetical protein
LAGLNRLGRLDQRVLGRANFLQDCIQISKRFIHRERVHFASVFIRAGFNRRFQKMPGNLDGQRIGYDPAGSLVVFHPCWMRQGNPNGTPADKKLYINSVGVPRRNGDDQGLVNTVESLSSPAVGGVKVIVHTLKTISEQPQTINAKADAGVCDVTRITVRLQPWPLATYNHFARR